MLSSMEKLNEFTSSDGHRRQRLLRDHRRDARLFLDQGVQTGKQGSASRKYDAPVKNICGQLRRRPL